MTDLAGNFIDHDARKIAILNNGVYTEAPLAEAALQISEARGVEILILNTRVLGRGADRLLQQSAGGHADERETSVMLAVAPETVRMERARPAYRPAGAKLPFSPDPASPGYNPTGATGDPTLATAEKGRAIPAEMERETAVARRAPAGIGVRMRGGSAAPLSLVGRGAGLGARVRLRPATKTEEEARGASLRCARARR